MKDKAGVLQAHKENEERERRIVDDERQRATEELDGDDNSKIIIMPKYATDPRLKVDREVDKPPDSLFAPLGWDENRDTNRKHYRLFYNDELENIKEIFPKPSPFNSFELIRGQSRGLKKGGFLSIFSKAKKQDESGQVSTLRSVGVFKGIIEIESSKSKAEYK